MSFRVNSTFIISFFFWTGCLDGRGGARPVSYTPIVARLVARLQVLSYNTIRETYRVS